MGAFSFSRMGEELAGIFIPVADFIRIHVWKEGVVAVTDELRLFLAVV